MLARMWHKDRTPNTVHRMFFSLKCTTALVCDMDKQIFISQEHQLYWMSALLFHLIQKNILFMCNKIHWSIYTQNYWIKIMQLGIAFFFWRDRNKFKNKKRVAKVKKVTVTRHGWFCMVRLLYRTAQVSLASSQDRGAVNQSVRCGCWCRGGDGGGWEIGKIRQSVVGIGYLGLTSLELMNGF